MSLVSIGGISSFLLVSGDEYTEVTKLFILILTEHEIYPAHKC